MDEEPRSFDDVMARLRRGDDEAAEEVFRRFTRRLIGLARQRLPAEIAAKVGADDVIQSVYRSFFAHQADGRFDQLRDWEEIWKLLAHFTVWKCGRKIAEYRTQRRDTRREVSYLPLDGESSADWEAIAEGPTPSEAAQLIETIEVLMRDLDPREQQILNLALQGHAAVEIAGVVERTERMVQRTLGKIRRRLERMRDEDR